jgi:hypothetical protein
MRGWRLQEKGKLRRQRRENGGQKEGNCIVCPHLNRFTSERRGEKWTTTEK